MKKKEERKSCPFSIVTGSCICRNCDYIYMTESYLKWTTCTENHDTLKKRERETGGQKIIFVIDHNAVNKSRPAHSHTHTHKYWLNVVCGGQASHGDIKDSTDLVMEAAGVLNSVACTHTHTLQHTHTQSYESIRVNKVSPHGNRAAYLSVRCHLNTRLTGFVSQANQHFNATMK